ncbi:MAG: class II aldolase/adducin family protein [Rhizobiales bacterium]|nr:class II aldolase/adducin family protein [Hyphomicrobiales bacterium]
MTPLKDRVLCQKILETARALSPQGLGIGRSGNVSARIGSGMLITPSGVAYDDMQPEDIIFVDGDGIAETHSLLPSSEWQLHLAIYQSRPEASAIVHCHSRFATVLACAHMPIPAFHYMVAVAGGTDIRCASYALFGSEELSRHVLVGLEGRKACLMANHGQVAFGADLASAFELALEVEDLAAQYCALVKLGKVNLLSEAEMGAVLARFKTYGRQG